MKTLPNLNNIETLEKFKQHLSEAVDKKIERRKIDERLSSLSTMSIGQLKYIFESIASSIFNENKAIIGKYVKTIKENKDLQTLYTLYENATNPLFTKSAKSLVDTMVSLSESLDKKAVKSGKEQLCSVVKEAVIASNITSDEFDELANNNKELNESLSYLFNTKVSAKNLFEHTNKRNLVEQYIDEKMASDDEHEDITVNEAISEYNKIFSELDSWEGEAVRDLTLCRLSESSEEELFNRYKDDCINLLSEKIEISETFDEKSRLSTMKEQLAKKEYKVENLEENIMNLAELKHTLTE